MAKLQRLGNLGISGKRAVAGLTGAVEKVGVEVMTAPEAPRLNLRASTAVFEVVGLYFQVASLWKRTFAA